MVYKSELYMHELDRKAFDALNKFPKLVKLQEAYSSKYDDKAARYEILSSAIRLNDNQMPEVYKLLPPVCEKLGIEVPELFYMDNGKEINAFTSGVDNPFICITSGAVDRLPRESISSILAHECGHIACKHVLYHSMAAFVINALTNTPIRKIPVIGSFLTPALVRSLLFWDRCSELSADRAAALCDNDIRLTTETLLRVHGFRKDINVDEFMKQAMDLKDFVDESKANKIIEEMVVSDESHPRLATRVYECNEWVKSEKYHKIIEGAYTAEDSSKEDAEDLLQIKAIDAEVEVSADSGEPSVSSDDIKDIDAELNRIDKELDRYTNNANKIDYAIAVACGLISGALDACFLGECSITKQDLKLSHKQVNKFIEQFADSRGLKGKSLKETIAHLERTFKVAQDNTWSGAGIGVSAKDHHLADLAHHPTPLGLASAIIVQFLRVGTFVNKDGEWHFKFVETSLDDIKRILLPAVLTGFLNWLVMIALNKYEDETGEEIPKYIKVISHTIASTPELVEIVRCADNWFGHLVSDMGGSKQTAGKGMGVPGVLLSLIYEISALPILKDTGLPGFVNALYQNEKINLRSEIAVYKNLGKQALPVMYNELLVRACYLFGKLGEELGNKGSLKEVDWQRVIPFNNRTVDRMVMISSMTFTVADTADAAVRAALESGGNWVVFSGRFVSRFNYVGAGRAALAIVKEISNEKKEAELIHEKLLLTEAKTEIVITEVEKYKQALEERLCTYLAEDIKIFISGFDTMDEGIAKGDSDLVIKGNVEIQRVLGREPQFTTQKEFDELMDSDESLSL